MKTELISPAVENSGMPFNVETRPEHSNAAWTMPASTDHSKVDAKSVCDTARCGPFGPFRFRVGQTRTQSTVRGRVPRKDGAAGYFKRFEPRLTAQYARERRK
jgi:hypothetical protein